MKKAPFVLLLLLSCNTPETLLPKFEDGWQFARKVEEMSVDAGLIYESDSSDLGRLYFMENGSLEWINPDSVEQTFSWSYDKNADEFSVPDWTFEASLSGGTIRQEGLVFKILESKQDAQLWRAVHQRTIFNPFTQDSSVATIIVQWKLER